MKNLIKMPEVFRDNYSPQKLPQRKKELKRINLILERGLENLAIIGPSGSGKTVTVGLALRQQDCIPHIYISCSPDFGLKSLLISIANYFGINCNPRKENTQGILHKIKSSLNEPFFIILDDIDRLKLSQICTIFKIKDALPNIFFIIVTNKFGLLRELKSLCNDVLHRISPYQIHFKPYTATEATEILVERCKEGLVSGSYNTEGIHRLGALVKREADGDIRTGIKAIKLAVDTAVMEDRDSINFDDLKTAFTSVLTDDLMDMVDCLSIHEKILFLSVLQKEGPFTFHMQKYLHIVNHELKGLLHPLNKSNIWRSFNRLTKAGLIFPEKKGGKTIYYPASNERNKEKLERKLRDEII